MDPALEHLASRSLWLDGVRDSLVARDPLPGDAAVDVAVVGAGFTGLWTAYALLEREPTLRVVVIDRHHVGYGASGRNGGWASALFAGSRDRMARLGGPGAVLAHHRAMVDANLFRAAGPRALGGEECGLAEGAEIARILGRADLSVGWLFVQAGATMHNFGPRLDAETGAEVYPGPASVVAAGFPDGETRAEVVEGGYVVSGRWNFEIGRAHV